MKICFYFAKMQFPSSFFSNAFCFNRTKLPSKVIGRIIFTSGKILCLFFFEISE